MYGRRNTSFKMKIQTETAAVHLQAQPPLPLPRQGRDAAATQTEQVLARPLTSPSHPQTALSPRYASPLDLDCPRTSLQSLE